MVIDLAEIGDGDDKVKVHDSSYLYKVNLVLDPTGDERRLKNKYLWHEPKLRSWMQSDHALAYHSNRDLEMRSQ